jgi:hypothetical protein
MPTAPLAEALTFERSFTLNVYSHFQNRCYDVTFESEKAAIDYITRQDAQDKADNAAEGCDGSEFAPPHYHVWDFASPEQYDLVPESVLDLMFPGRNETCEHGLSTDLCAGYGHYPPDRPGY